MFFVKEVAPRRSSAVSSPEGPFGSKVLSPILFIVSYIGPCISSHLWMPYPSLIAIFPPATPLFMTLYSQPFYFGIQFLPTPLCLLFHPKVPTPRLKQNFSFVYSSLSLLIPHCHTLLLTSISYIVQGNIKCV